MLRLQPKAALAHLGRIQIIGNKKYNGYQMIPELLKRARHRSQGTPALTVENRGPTSDSGLEVSGAPRLHAKHAPALAFPPEYASCSDHSRDRQTSPTEGFCAIKQLKPGQRQRQSQSPPGFKQPSNLQ